MGKPHGPGEGAGRSPSSPSQPHRPKKRAAKPEIMQHTPLGKAWRLDLPPDDGADRRVAEFIAKVIRPAGD